MVLRNLKFKRHQSQKLSTLESMSINLIDQAFGKSQGSRRMMRGVRESSSRDTNLSTAQQLAQAKHFTHTRGKNEPKVGRVRGYQVNKPQQEDEIWIEPCQLHEEQLMILLKNYFEEFKNSVEEENAFLKSFPFDVMEIMTLIKTQQEPNVFLIHFRDHTEKRGLLVTHVDRYNFDERKIIISHLSMMHLDLESEILLFNETVLQVNKFLFKHDPCSEIQVALVTFEKDDIVFGVSEFMEDLFKQNNFVQVEFQDDYETQLYCKLSINMDYSFANKYKRCSTSRELAKETAIIVNRACIFRITVMCDMYRSFKHQRSIFNSELQIILMNMPREYYFSPKLEGSSSINNGSVNIAILSDLAKGDLKQDVSSIECDWEKVNQFDNLCKEYELLREIKHEEFSSATQLQNHLRKQNSIFDFFDKLKEKSSVKHNIPIRFIQYIPNIQINYSNTEQYFRWNSSQQIMIDELPHIRINYVYSSLIFITFNPYHFFKRIIQKYLFIFTL